MSKSDVKLETIVSLAKRRGFVFQSSEIYGGLSGFYDYGPYGVELVNNIKAAWWDAYVRRVPENYGIDSSIIQNPKLWEASGHVAGFNDPMVECGQCNSRLRADHLAGTDSTDVAKLQELLKDKKCPVCGEQKFSDVRTFNMMLKTYVGAIESDENVAYLRPETAGPIFTNFDLVQGVTRSKIPFGIGQIGKAFRNEISPRDFIFRVRELEQMELQYFIKEENSKEEYENARQFNWNFLQDTIGLSKTSLQWHEHDEDERAHYARAAHDIQFKFPFGFKELFGTHDRSDFDLSQHAKHSGKKLEYFDQANNERFVPNVIESSVGVGRLFLAVLTDAYTEDEVEGEKRVVLKIKPELAPVKVAVMPLLKNKPELVKKAKEVYDKLAATKVVEYDEVGSIGKRYRRQDEIGTPECITIDFDTIEDDTVTVRDRDTTKQKRVKIAELG